MLGLLLIVNHTNILMIDIIVAFIATILLLFNTHLAVLTWPQHQLELYFNLQKELMDIQKVRRRISRQGSHMTGYARSLDRLLRVLWANSNFSTNSAQTASPGQPHHGGSIVGTAWDGIGIRLACLCLFLDCLLFALLLVHTTSNAIEPLKLRTGWLPWSLQFVCYIGSVLTYGCTRLLDCTLH